MILETSTLEHRRPISAIREVSQHVHMDDPDHNISMDYTNILEVEPKWFERDVKEVILIQTMQPSLNKE